MKRGIMLVAAWLAATLGLAAEETALDRALGRAVAAYEDEKYGNCVELVDEVVREGGESPRAESLRALALHELGRPAEAFQSLERYAELTRGLPGLENNAAHRELLELLEKYRTRLETEKQEKEHTLQKERDRAAAQVTAAARAEISGKRAGLVRTADAALAQVPADRLKDITEADVARLKEAGLAAFVARFDPRLFAIPRLDTGNFKLGMTRDAFEQLVYRRLRAYQTENSFLREALDSYQLSPEETVWLGYALPVQEGTLAEWVQNSALQQHAFTLPGYDRNRHDERLRELLQVMAASEAPALASLSGASAPAQLVEVHFDGHDCIDQLTFAAILPASVSDPQAVVQALRQRFGPLATSTVFPDGIDKQDETFGDVQALAFKFPAVAGLVLDARVARAVEPLLRSPWVLELRLTRLPAEGDPGNAEKLTAIVPFSQRKVFTRLRTTQRLNAWLQQANGEIIIRNGRPARLMIGPNAFELRSDGLSFEFGFRDYTGGQVELVGATAITPTQIERIEERKPDAGGLESAPTWELHLRAPAPAYRARDGAEPEPMTLALVPVYGTRDDRALLDAVALALPDPGTLDADTVGRLGRLLAAYSPMLDAIVTPFLRAADEQGKLSDPRLLVDRYAGRDAAQWLKYLRRSATAGNRDSAWDLIKHFEPIWREGKGSAAVAARVEVLAWAERFADAGDPNAMRKLVEVLAREDYGSADRWIRKLASLGEAMPLGFDSADAAQISRRAAQLQRLRGLAPEERVKAYVPDLPESALGQKFKQYAKPAMQFVKQEEYRSPTSGRRVRVYQRGEKISSGPQVIWVNRDGIIIGEHYLLGGSGTFVWKFRDEAAGLRQVFGDQLVAIPTAGTNIVEGVTVRNAGAKTIELLRYQEKASYLKVIDHTRE